MELNPNFSPNANSFSPFANRFMPPQRIPVGPQPPPVAAQPPQPMPVHPMGPTGPMRPPFGQPGFGPPMSGPPMSGPYQDQGPIPAGQPSGYAPVNGMAPRPMPPQIPGQAANLQNLSQMPQALNAYAALSNMRRPQGMQA
jgi:hypothetical protein